MNYNDESLETNRCRRPVCVAVPLQVAAWNAPTHMVTGAIAYRILENESPRTVSIIKTLLEKHPWYADRWRDDLEKLPESQRIEMLFMLAARWADDIRMQAKIQRQAKWHYINFPFKPASEPEDIKPLPPDPDNILSALAENGESSKARYRRINGQSRWRGYSISLATFISRYIRYSCSAENIRTAIVAAMKCAFG